MAIYYSKGLYSTSAAPDNRLSSRQVSSPAIGTLSASLPTEPYERISHLIRLMRATLDSIEELRDHLQERWGLEFSRICHAINAINGEHFTTADALVSETGLSHRAVA